MRYLALSLLVCLPSGLLAADDPELSRDLAAVQGKWQRPLEDQA